ncbi:MAG: hypothetical protein D8M58_10340 [Calditrichaeota bacterium]|nr:MAG: hypothetical protein DWQ03_09715 [Calditrichota bacterium]MBL1205788.1 hypothetical protein [Calditrichota bacterium]NOG45616.1 SpoIIE family protein phosphatase [Calditrichota bacterium]
MNLGKFPQILFCFALLWITNNLFAQNTDVVFERLNTSHGLSNNTAQRVFQDSKGFIWVATADGLNRYDGYSFKTFRNDPQDTTSIISNTIWSIYEDRTGNIWIGSEGGLSLFVRETETFKNFIYEAMPNIPEQAIRWVAAVFSITQLEENVLWMGTVFNGLTKFDITTKQFTHFLPDPDAPIGNSNIVIWLANDYKDKNTLWFSIDRGISSFNTSNNTFKNVNLPKELFSGQVWEVYPDSKGYIWAGTEKDGLIRLNLENDEYVLFTPDPTNPESISGFGTWAVIEDKNETNTFWVGTRNGLNKYDLNTNTFFAFKSDVHDQSTLSSDFVFDIFQDRTGVLWIATAGGLDKIDPGRVPFRNYAHIPAAKNSLNENDVYALLESTKDDEVLWIGTYGGGINRLDATNNSFTYIKHNPGNLNSLSGDSIRSLYQDPDDNGEILWVGVAGKGLDRYDLKNKKFENYSYQSGNPNSLSSNTIRQIYETRDGMLWLATASGLNKFDRKKEIFTRYLLQDTTYVAPIRKLLLTLHSTKKPLQSILKVGESADHTQSFTISQKTSVLIAAMGEGQDDMYDHGWLEDSDGKKIWIMDFDESKHAGGGAKNRLHLKLLELESGQYNLRYVSDIGHSYSNWNVAEPINASMWGIQVFEINNEEKRIISQNINKNEKPNSIAGSNISSIIEDGYGMLWVATQDGGLSKLDRKSGNFTNYRSSSETNSLSNNIAFSLHEDNYGSLWIGTQSGLNKFDAATNSFKSWTTKDGLPNNAIINFLEDESGKIWMATGNGITKFDPNDESLTFINYGVQDGVKFDQYYIGSKTRTTNGSMFFGGRSGFVSFKPGKNNPQPPHTLISDFQIFNQSVLPGKDSPLQKHISETESLELSHDQNVFSFEFTALHYSRPEKNLYLFKMEGFDKDWIDGTRRFAPYTNLDPGKYTFQVKAANSDGVWNEKGASVNITIHPPWWRTYWAYGGYVFLFLGIIFAIDRIQRRRMIIKTRERMKIQAAEHRAESAELQARAVQAENERKSKELEEARQLQLSMLPKELPQLPNLDIAVYMQTATEVGGDYYDFHVSLDGTLTVVIGDATGHGMKAGTMVTTAKSLFNSYAPNPDILFSFQEITRCIKQMNFGKLSMCLTMLKIKGDKMQISTAGMPPSFIFRGDTKVVEEHLFKAMPLGTMEKFPYEVKDTTLKAGDTILLMSDGLPELSNNSGDMYGYKKIRNGFEDIAEKSPEEIITYLKNEGSDWVNHEAPDDDVTFVVIKVKN